MTHQRSTEIGNEAAEQPVIERELRCLDDIPREIADRRIHAAFGENIAPENSAMLRETPDLIEDAKQFEESAERDGLLETEGVLGWSTRPESAAHVLRGDVGKEIATLIHEDLHRLTHRDTQAELTATPDQTFIYEGITEHFTERAAAGLHGNEPGECYPENVRQAELLEQMTGDDDLRHYFFEHELPEEITKAIEHIRQIEEQ